MYNIKANSNDLLTFKLKEEIFTITKDGDFILNGNATLSDSAHLFFNHLKQNFLKHDEQIRNWENKIKNSEKSNSKLLMRNYYLTLALQKQYPIIDISESYKNEFPQLGGAIVSETTLHVPSYGTGDIGGEITFTA